MSKVDLENKAGLQIGEKDLDNRLISLRDLLQAHLSANDIPATVRLTCEPSLVVESTARRWSFDIRPVARASSVKLRARFRQGKEDRRLRRILVQNIKPASIWRDAEIESRTGNGFELQDNVLPGEPGSDQESAFLDLVVRRALELHEIL